MRDLPIDGRLDAVFRRYVPIERTAGERVFEAAVEEEVTVFGPSLTVKRVPFAGCAVEVAATDQKRRVLVQQLRRRERMAAHPRPSERGRLPIVPFDDVRQPRTRGVQGCWNTAIEDRWDGQFFGVVIAKDERIVIANQRKYLPAVAQHRLLVRLRNPGVNGVQHSGRHAPSQRFGAMGAPRGLFHGARLRVKLGEVSPHVRRCGIAAQKSLVVHERARPSGRIRSDRL